MIIENVHLFFKNMKVFFFFFKTQTWWSSHLSIQRKQIKFSCEFSNTVNIYFLIVTQNLNLIIEK